MNTNKSMTLKYVYGDTELGYRLDECDSVYRPAEEQISNIQFEGFNGWENVRSLKSAVDKLMVENPAKTFANKMKTGVYEGASEGAVAKEAAIVNVLSELWNYPIPGESFCPELNVMMLLANALTLIAENQEYFTKYYEEKNAEKNSNKKNGGDSQ